MPLTTLILATPPTLSASYCFTTFKRLAQDIIGGSQFTFQSSVGNSFFNNGSTTPTVENQIFPWFRTGSNQNGWYYFSGGSWIMAHPVPASSQERRFWVGVEADVWAYDGGDGIDPGVTAPTLNTGAMWEVDHNFDGKFPIGPGTLPGYQTVPVPTVIPVNGTGGAEGQNMILTEAQLAAHSHPIGTEVVGADETGANEAGQLRVGGGDLRWDLQANVHIGHTRNTGDSDPIEVPTLPPYRAAYVIMRTARLNYTA